MGRRANVSNELIVQVADSSRASPAFIVFMAMSGVLATIAFLANSVPILIGAMVISPIFAPLSLVAFGLAGGQHRLAARALGTAVLGLAVSVGFAMATAWFVRVTGILASDEGLLHLPLLEERVRPGGYSAIAAVAAGITGAIATAKQKIDALVGTVAAVALVPAGAAAGIAWTAGDPVRALGGVVLLGVNAMLIVAMGLLVIAFFGRRLEA